VPRLPVRWKVAPLPLAQRARVDSFGMQAGFPCARGWRRSGEVFVTGCPASSEVDKQRVIGGACG